MQSSHTNPIFTEVFLKASFHGSVTFLILFITIILSVSCSKVQHESVQREHLRMIIETDAGGDPDDEQSLVRFFLYLNEWDVEGIIATRPHTREDNPNPDPNGLAICRTFIDAYDSVYSTLSTHDSGYPTPDYLRGITVAGYNGVEDGVDLIIRVVDADDPRPVWFSNWGTDDETIGNLKRALDRVLAERGSEGYAKFKNKIRLCSDDKFQQHTSEIEPEWKFWVYTKMPNMDGGRWYHRFAPLTASAGGFDIEADVRTGHGPLGPLYAVTKGVTGEAQKEGDTPEFLYLVETGMNDPFQPTWGSWAGRFGVRDDSLYNYNVNWYWPNVRDSLDGTFSRDNTLSRWAVHIQNDFKARMEWCVKDYAAANHQPKPALQGDLSREILYLDAAAGSEVALSAAESHDPDGNRLYYHWFCYPEAGSYGKNVEINGADGESCTVNVPLDAAGQTIHVVLVCTDDGNPSLTRYRRAVLNVK